MSAVKAAYGGSIHTETKRCGAARGGGKICWQCESVSEQRAEQSAITSGVPGHVGLYQARVKARTVDGTDCHSTPCFDSGAFLFLISAVFGGEEPCRLKRSRLAVLAVRTVSMGARQHASGCH